MAPERTLLMLLLGGVAVGCAVVLWPFFPAILWAGILAYTTWPAFAWCRARLGLGPVTAAGAMVAAISVLVVLPMALAAPTSAEVEHFRKLGQAAIAAGLPAAPSWLADVPLVGEALAARWTSWAEDISGLFAALQPYFGMAGELALTVLLAMANGVAVFLLALFIAFFLFVSGERVAEHLVAVLRRTAGPKADRLIALTGATIRGVVYGIMGTAVVQAILTGFGLWVVGVPYPLPLGVLAGALSVLPIGAPMVWIPAGLWLMWQGKLLWGLALLVYGGVAISGADTIIRPYFVARGANLPFLLTVLGVLGGALAFGFLGVFVGPVLLGLGYTLVLEYGAGGEDTAEGR